MGTLTLAIPSIIPSFGTNNCLENPEMFKEQIGTPISRLRDGETIRKGDPSYKLIVNFIKHYIEYHGEPSTISKGRRGAGTNQIEFDGEEIHVTIEGLIRKIDPYTNYLDKQQERRDAKQKRYYSVLGIGIYLLAIIFQIAKVVIPS
ncbi:hypothetical protein [Haladaptatus sp. R4]|uniref:hypothetical protein n=1 Tax=Haladaptatus sp. R4 TaxID=1679489 RepID=UPI0012377A94|nr:hypothetical protein [Haladaptatus sp. R4]